MIGPDQQERVRTCIRLGIEEGARLVTDGPQIPEGLEKGNYVRPTVFADPRQLHAHRAGGDLRPGPGGHPL